MKHLIASFLIVFLSFAASPVSAQTNWPWDRQIKLPGIEILVGLRSDSIDLTLSDLYTGKQVSVKAAGWKSISLRNRPLLCPEGFDQIVINPPNGTALCIKTTMRRTWILSETNSGLLAIIQGRATYPWYVA